MKIEILSNGNIRVTRSDINVNEETKKLVVPIANDEQKESLEKFFDETKNRSVIFGKSFCG